MSLKQIKSPKSRSNESQSIVSQKQFLGSIRDVPLVEIPDGFCNRMINIYGFGNWAKARPGTRLYSDITLPGLNVFNIVNNELWFATTHGLSTGDKVGFYTDGTAPSPLNPNGPRTTYYVRKINGTTIKLATTWAGAMVGTTINLTNIGTGTHYIYYKERLNSRLDHKENKQIIKHYGTKVFVSNRQLHGYTEVINTDPVVPLNEDSTMVSYEKSAILAAGAIYKIILDDDYYWMFRINIPLCDILIGDTYVGTYIYRYAYSQSIISGSGNRNRVSNPTNAILMYESGVAQSTTTNKNISEVAFATAIVADGGIGAIPSHVITNMELPITNQAITHFPIYRTKNICTTTNGAGNNKAYLVWVDDIPVCKVLTIKTLTLTMTSSAGEFEIGDVGNTIDGVDIAGNSKTATISKFIDKNNVLLSGSSFVDGTEYYVTIGEGRVMNASQSGHFVALNGIPADGFYEDDVGRRIFWDDGDSCFIVSWKSSNVVEVSTDDSKANLGMAIQFRAGTYAFRRKFNDTIVDDGVTANQIGLTERMLASVKTSVYTPQVNYRPIPSSNLVSIESGIAIFGQRDNAKYYYSAIGAKSYTMGTHRLDVQESKLPVGIRYIMSMPGRFILFCVSKTYNINVSMPIEQGNPQIAESITKITEATEIDGEIGVTAWQTICPINSMLYIAVTSEPAVRLFDGNSWGKENLTIQNGFPAVSNMLFKIDNYYKIVAWYSPLGGYKIVFTKWDKHIPGTGEG